MKTSPVNIYRDDGVKELIRDFIRNQRIKSSKFEGFKENIMHDILGLSGDIISVKKENAASLIARNCVNLNH